MFLYISNLQAVHQIGAVNRSGEYRSRENAFGLLCVEDGEQPLPHNPRKQRKNPAGAGSGERFGKCEWRSGRDWERTFYSLFSIGYELPFSRRLLTGESEVARRVQRNSSRSGGCPGRVTYRWPQRRFLVKPPRWEPSALTAHARTCPAGAG